MQCKSLWIKASAKCINVNVNVNTFSKREQTCFSAYHKHLSLYSQSLERFQPLSTWPEAWQAIPGVLEWVMATIRRGYTLQFTQRPPHFRGVLATTVRSEDAQVLCACRGDESAGKRSHINRSSSPERVRILQSLLPRPQKRWWPATYSGSQTPESSPGKKVVQDDHWFMSLDLKDAYFHIQVVPHHR